MLKWNDLKKNKYKTRIEFSPVNIVAIFCVVGVVLLCQIPNVASPDFIERERSIEQNNLKYLKGFETIAANVTLLINAIVLQDALHKKTITMQNVIADAIQVQNLTIFDSIDEMTISNSESFINEMYFLISKTPKTSNKFTKSLKNLVLPYKRSVNITHLNDMLTFSHSLSNLTNAKRLLNDTVSTMNLLVEELNKKNRDVGQTLSTIIDISDEAVTELNGLNFFAKDQTLEEYSKTSRFFVYLISQYEQITNKTFLKQLDLNLNNLQTSATNLSLLLESENIIKQLDELCKFIDPHVCFSHIGNFIGFSRGLKDMEFLLKDLDDERLKKVLNRGKTLDELKVLLKPLSKLIAKLALIDEVWVRSDREKFFYLIRRVLTTSKTIRAFKTTSNSNFLTTVKNALKTLEQISNQNNSSLTYYQKLLNSSDILMKINSGLRELSLLSGKVKLIHVELLPFNPFSNDSDEVENLKQKLYDLNFTTEINKVINKITFIEQQRSEITHSLALTSNYENFIKSSGFESVLETLDITNDIETEINQLINYVQLLDVFRSHVKIERIDIKKLVNVLVTVKNKTRELPKLEKEFQNEVKKTKREHENVNCLETFPHSRETAFILALFQQASAFYEKSALVNIYSEFLNNGLALSRKIESSFLADRNGTEAVIEYFISLNESMALKLQKVTELQKQLRVKGQDPKSIGGVLSALHNVFSDSGRLFYINSALNNLKATEVGQWNEFLKLEQSLAQFSVIENIVPENIEDVSPLIGKSGWFLRCILAKRIPYENTPWSDIVIAVAIAVVALGCTSGIIFAINWSRDFMKEYKRQYGYDHA